MVKQILKDHSLGSRLDRRRPYSCKKCHANFLSLSNCISHTWTHLEKFRFACIYCPKKFKDKNLLNEHLKSHKRRHFFICGRCGKVYTDAAQLKLHRKTHTDDKLYEKNFKELCANRKLKFHTSKINETVEDSFSEDDMEYLKTMSRQRRLSLAINKNNLKTDSATLLCHESLIKNSKLLIPRVVLSTSLTDAISMAISNN